MNKTYKLSDVKLVCDAIYGRTINPRTWIRWKKQAGINVDCRCKIINYEELGRLITLAALKKKQPTKDFRLTEIIQAKQNVLDEYYANKYNYQKFLVPNSCKGCELLGVLNIATGRDISLRSLYRLGKKANIAVHLNNSYSKDEVMTLILQIL